MTQQEQIEEAATKEAFNLCINFLKTAGYPDAAVALTKFLTEDAAPEPELMQPVASRSVAQKMGFTGNTCSACGSLQMVRNGSCEKCTTCGETTGCS